MVGQRKTIFLAIIFFSVSSTVIAKDKDLQKKEEEEYKTTTTITWYVCAHGYDAVLFANVFLKSYAPINFNWTKKANESIKTYLNEVIAFFVSFVIALVELFIIIGCLMVACVILVYGICVMIFGIVFAIIIFVWNALMAIG